jgi:hypothetical protein
MARELHVTSPALAGQDVFTVQTRLASLGWSPGVLDGEYGPATAAAVSAFQQASGLEVDGVVGRVTRAALRSKDAATAPPPTEQAPARSVGAKALAEAIAHLGEKEKPAGSNRTPFGKWFGVDAVPWCNIFVSYCFSIGAGTTIAQGFHGAGCAARGCAYVPTTEAWLRATGQWIGPGEPGPGDIVIYNWDNGLPDHVGIVETYLGGGKFTAIEGNTAVGNDSNGGEVMRRLRYLSQVDGFGRVTA